MYTIDLHSHSVASPDGSLTLADYRTMLQTRRLDYIAVTDHDTIEFAQHARAELGDALIVGEEITTAEGEMIGLFLQQAVPPGHTLAETASLIHEQGGLVYIPHPFETVRKGVRLPDLDIIAAQVDVIEIHNGRALFQNKSAQAEAWSRDHGIAGAASSDAHGLYGWGKTYSIIDRVPRADTLPQVLQAARYADGFVGMRGMLYPKYNRLRKALKYA